MLTQVATGKGKLFQTREIMKSTECLSGTKTGTKSGLWLQSREPYGLHYKKKGLSC